MSTVAPSAARAWWTTVRLMVGTVLTRGRLAAVAAVSLVGLLTAVAIATGDLDDPREAAGGMLGALGLTVLVPLTALLVGSATLGDPVEDRTLVYLWLRPVPRWVLATAATTATVAVTVPLTVVPLVAMAALTGTGGSIVAGTALATLVGAVGYSGLFCWLGLRVRRSLAWGLAYILIWEGFVANAGSGAARLAVRSWTRSVLARVADVDLSLADASLVNGLLVPPLVAVVATVLAARRLRAMDVA